MAVRQTPSPQVTLAITGASGAQYGLRLLECLVAAQWQVFCLISRAAKVVLQAEMDIGLEDCAQSVEPVMVICPCSTGTLSSIACGLSSNLVQRAATVALKERHKLIVVPRETPYSDVLLENMLRLSRMGCVVLPASPGFYHRPTTVDDMVDFVVARILDQLDITQELIPGWGGENEENRVK